MCESFLILVLLTAFFYLIVCFLFFSFFVCHSFSLNTDFFFKEQKRWMLILFIPETGTHLLSGPEWLSVVELGLLLP